MRASPLLGQLALTVYLVNQDRKARMVNKVQRAIRASAAKLGRKVNQAPKVLQVSTGKQALAALTVLPVAMDAMA